MLLVQQVPMPPLPPGSEMSVSGSLDGIAAIVLLLGAGLIVAAMLWPLIKAIARRIEGGAVNAALQAELDTLRDRVRQLEDVPMRITDLEERLDFTERVVAQSREPDRLQP